VALHWAHSDALLHAGEVVLAIRGQAVGKFKIRTARAANRAVLVSLEGIADRDRAETMRGATVSVARDSLPPLGPGEYYLCDLVGATVVGPGGAVGEVVEVRMHPSVDALVVRAPDGGLWEQPIAEPWIAAVDVANGRVELTSTEGLVEA
jgi:16S rRNA processing protein RimM